MAMEIERKFLVKSDDYKQLAEPVKYIQGYIAILNDRIVRVRIAGETAYITIKIRISNLIRKEYEYEIPIADADELLNEASVTGIVEKVRYTFSSNGNVWEVDEFKGENEGLVVAEIELSSADQLFDEPTWLGMEVTDDDRYINANLAMNPYTKWI
jgi:adenylate cyclase